MSSASRLGTAAASASSAGGGSGEGATASRGRRRGVRRRVRRQGRGGATGAGAGWRSGSGSLAEPPGRQVPGRCGAEAPPRRAGRRAPRRPAGTTGRWSGRSPGASARRTFTGISQSKTLSPSFSRSARRLGARRLGAIVDHGEEHAEKTAAPAVPPASRAAASMQRLDAVEGEKVRHGRHDEVVGRDQRALRERVERRRTVEQDPVVGARHGRQYLTQLRLAIAHRRELDIGVHQVGGGGEEIDSRRQGRADRLGGRDACGRGRRGSRARARRARCRG